jgi:hypothetical protein
LVENGRKSRAFLEPFLDLSLKWNEENQEFLGKIWNQDEFVREYESVLFGGKVNRRVLFVIVTKKQGNPIIGYLK